MLSVFELFIIVTSVVSAFNLELLIFLGVLRFGHLYVLQLIL